MGRIGTALSSLGTRITAGLTYPHCALGSRTVSARYLLAQRCVSLVFCAAILTLGMARWFIKHDGTVQDFGFFFYLTHLSFISLTGYLSLTLYLSWRAARWIPSRPVYVVPRGVAVVHAFLFSYNVVAHFIVTIVYWLLLRDSFTKSTSAAGRTVSASMHGVSLVMILADAVCGTMHVRAWALAPIFVCIALYTGWAHLYHAIADEWVYAFLDPQSKVAKFAYPGVPLLFVVAFGAVKVLLAARDRWTEGRELSLPDAVYLADQYAKTQGDAAPPLMMMSMVRGGSDANGESGIALASMHHSASGARLVRDASLA
ncbi:hypothetical protein H9P43_009221 [Blastocladiella emersonii ATCC 22665]|nr:hypothetical protein H9P43_009221 [Blastocladiella emersonii ATCC 22665]